MMGFTAMEDFFEKHKALIITILIFAVLFLSLYNIRISGENRSVKEMLVELESLKTEEEPVEETQKTEEVSPEQVQRSIRTHQAFNEDRQEEIFNRQLQEIIEKNSRTEEESSDPETAASQGNYSFSNPKNKPPRQKSEGEKTSAATSANMSGLKDTSISYSLRDRTAVAIPNPVYTCSSSGKIVVNITVDSGGNVINTSINKSSSTSSNQCLVDQALEYASKAKFSELPGRNSQLGTITYNFKP